MKKILLAIALLSIGIILNSQNLSNDIYSIEKQGGKLINSSTDEIISDSTLEQLLEPEYLGFYSKACRQRKAAKTLWYVNGACAVSTVTCFSMMFYHYYSDATDGPTYAFVCAVLGINSMIATTVTILPPLALTIISNRNLNKVVKGYNQRNNELSLNFGATNNGIGLTLKF